MAPPLSSLATTHSSASSAAPSVAHPAQSAMRDAHLGRWRERLDSTARRSAQAVPMRACGRITRAAGLVLEATGLMLPIGANCLIELPVMSSTAHAEAEVVGFHGERLY